MKLARFVCAILHGVQSETCHEWWDYGWDISAITNIDERGVRVRRVFF